MKEKYIARVFIRAREHIHISQRYLSMHARLRRLMVLTVPASLPYLFNNYRAIEVSHWTEIPTLR